jgi:hypothetical protein
MPDDEDDLGPPIRLTNTVPPSPGLGIGRILGLVFASLLALFGLGVITAGGFFAWVDGSRGADGFLSTSTENLSTPTAALSSAKVDINVGGISWFADHLGTIRITATSTSGKPIFIGIAPQADVTRWLGATSVDRIKDLQFEPFSASLERLPGSPEALKPPGAQTFWTARAGGATAETLTWKVTVGNWAVVIVNADGSPGVAVSARFGAKFSWLGPLGLWVIIAGVVVFLFAAVVAILLLRSRTPRNPLTVRLSP